MEKTPINVDWSALSNYETKDQTSASQEFACTSEKGCEIVDISPQIVT